VILRYVLYPIRIVFPPLVVALIVIYLLNPVVTELQRRVVRRGLATLVVYIVVLSIVGVALAYLVQVVAGQVSDFVSRVPDLLARAQHGLGTVSHRLGLNLDSKAVVKQFERNGSVSHFVGRLTSYTSGVVHVALVVVLGPLIAFYLLVDLPRIQRGGEVLVPASRRAEIGRLAGDVNATLGGFFRGQLLVAFAMGLLSMFLFWLIGLPYFALLGAITGLFGLVPLIGTVIAAIPALFVALTSPHPTRGLLHVPGGWKLALATALTLMVVQQLDTRLLSPRVLSRASRLNPVTVLLSLLVGGTLLGLWGMLLAVPVVAAAKVVILNIWDTRATWPPQPSEEAARAPARSRPPLPSREEPRSGATGDDEADPSLGREPEPRPGVPVTREETRTG
jgi:predicted PurR-regulated permease PerM